MNRTFIIAGLFTVIYIVLILVYFLRRSKSHEQELTKFLQTAKDQVELHKQEATRQANAKVSKAMEVVQKVQQATAAFEEKAQQEYEQIIEDAKAEKREILAAAKSEVEDLFKEAEIELEEYRQHRKQEIEKNLIRMVTAVTQRVVEMSLDETKHVELIKKALDEVKTKKSRS